MSPISQWTIVQHSAYGYGDDASFAQGLETREVRTAEDQKMVAEANGLLFNSYADADTFADKAMYPEGTSGLYPNAQGTFAGDEIDGLAIYVPVRQVIG